MKKYRSILFDMDGVIVDSMPTHADTWRTIFREYGLDLTREDIYMREGMSGLSSIRDIFLEKTGASPSDESLKGLLEKKLILFETYRVEVFPLVGEILEFLKKKDVRLGLVTGSLKRSVRHVLPEDLAAMFNAVVTVEDITNGKPHPEPYRRAADKLDCGAAEALAVENAPLGIDSAKGAGMDCYAVETTLPARYLARADRIFGSHVELFDCMKTIFGE